MVAVAARDREGLPRPARTGSRRAELRSGDHLAALDTTTGLFTAWAPDAMRAVDDLQLHAGRLFVGGAFEALGGELRPFVAEVDRFSGLPTPWNPHPDDPVGKLATDGEVVFLLGSFEFVDGLFLPRLAAVDADTGEVLDWMAGQRSGTRTMLLTERGLIVSAGPAFAKGVVYHLAAFDYPLPLAASPSSQARVSGRGRPPP